MFQFIKKLFIRLLTSKASVSNNTKGVSLNEMNDSTYCY